MMWRYLALQIHRLAALPKKPIERDWHHIGHALGEKCSAKPIDRTNRGGADLELLFRPSRNLFLGVDSRSQLFRVAGSTIKE